MEEDTRKGRRHIEARQSLFRIYAGKQSPDDQMTKLHVQQAYPHEFRETMLEKKKIMNRKHT